MPGNSTTRSSLRVDRFGTGIWQRKRHRLGSLGLLALPCQTPIPRALGVASHSGFLSGCLISSNEGTWMFSHHASSAAPQTVQTAPPVCGNKNFSSVRLYSAPQLHRTIVAILGI